MLHRIPAVLSCLALACVATSADSAAPRTFPEAKTAGAELRYIGDIPVAILTGTPEQIGRQHGELLAGVGEKVIDFPKQFASEFGLGVLWPFMAQAGRTLMLNAPPRYRDEVKALAESSGFGDDRIVVANTLLELRRMACSSIIVEKERSATGSPLFGRNFDFPTLGELHKYSLLVIYRPEKRHAFASVGFPGLVGVFSGMNDAGLAVATLDVDQSGDGSRKFNPAGTPLALVFRRILEECTTVDEAQKLLKSEKATTWMNLAVCDREGGAVFEITPDNIARRDDEEHLVFCTNHFRAEGLSVGETCERYEKLQLVPKRPLDVEAVHARLHAANQERLTFQTMVFQPREFVLHLAFGEPPSSDDPFTRIELAPLFKSTDR